MSQVSDALDTLFTNLETDELKVVLPLGDIYLSNVIANPAPDNVVAQSLAFEPQFLAALPNVEATAAKDAATALKSLMDMEAATITAPTVTTPAATATSSATS
jgi:hypothetical protein